MKPICATNRCKRHTLAMLLAALPAFLMASTCAAAHTQGMDLSSWQGNISLSSWQQMKAAGKEFGFVRASRGATFGPPQPPTADDGDPYNRFDDEFLVQNITNGTAAGLLMGSYHFNRADIAGN